MKPEGHKEAVDPQDGASLIENSEPSRAKHTLSPNQLRFLDVMGLGRLPNMPGTWGSIGGFVFAIAVYLVLRALHIEHWLLPLFLVVVAALFFFAAPMIDKAVNASEEKDPSWIVIDEVAGLLVTLSWPVLWDTWWLPILGFLVFRFFDIAKPFPVSWADRKKGGLYVMLDDIIAGIMSLLVLIAIVYISRWYDWLYLLNELS